MSLVEGIRVGHRYAITDTLLFYLYFNVRNKVDNLRVI